jgi:hypothetical protein
MFDSLQEFSEPHTLADLADSVLGVTFQANPEAQQSLQCPCFNFSFCEQKPWLLYPPSKKPQTSSGVSSQSTHFQTPVKFASIQKKLIF